MNFWDKVVPNTNVEHEFKYMRKAFQAPSSSFFSEAKEEKGKDEYNHEQDQNISARSILDVMRFINFTVKYITGMFQNTNCTLELVRWLN